MAADRAVWADLAEAADPVADSAVLAAVVPAALAEDAPVVSVAVAPAADVPVASVEVAPAAEVQADDEHMDFVRPRRYTDR